MMSNVSIPLGPSLNFSKIQLSDKAVLDPILKKYGENSCQHSFTAMYCTNDKYGDEFILQNDWLYIHRAELDTEGYRTYLAPMGEGNLADAIEHICADAHSFGKKARFESVTVNFADKLKALYSDRFSFEEQRDLAEYIYTFENLSTLPGHPHSPKRTGIARFWDTYGDGVTIAELSDSAVSDILNFQEKWLAERVDDSNKDHLMHENAVIKKALSDFRTLEVAGIVIKYNGAVCAYALGFPLSDNCFDEFIEKGDREIGDIYRVLNQEFVNRCCASYDYINREEDLGVRGLRQVKKSYQPVMLLEKYVICEV